MSREAIESIDSSVKGIIPAKKLETRVKSLVCSHLSRDLRVNFYVVLPHPE